MKKIVLLFAIFSASEVLAQPVPCGTNPVYRQFDFWIGEWEAFGVKGTKAGDSRITLILDSCVILEEWTGTVPTKGLLYAGKSFNTYNARTNQWQQTWVDNFGGSTEYLEGRSGKNSIIFTSRPFAFSKDTLAIRRLSFFKLTADKVRQLGEITKNSGATWSIEYDLQYRRKSK